MDQSSTMYGGCPERVRVRSSEESKVRRSQERPREGQERSEPERNSQSWRCRGARWGIDIPILEAQGVDQTPIRCGSGAGGETGWADPQQPRACNTHVECLPHERCLKGLERLERGSLTRPTAVAEWTTGQYFRKSWIDDVGGPWARDRLPDSRKRGIMQNSTVFARGLMSEIGLLFFTVIPRISRVFIASSSHQSGTTADGGRRWVKKKKRRKLQVEAASALSATPSQRSTPMGKSNRGLDFDTALSDSHACAAACLGLDFPSRLLTLQHQSSLQNLCADIQET